MNDKTIELRWEHFEINVPNTFRNLWNDKDFADVTLATVDDQHIRAHKVILSSCSQFFRNIFLKNPHHNPLLYLKGIKYKELSMVIKFIYLGQCEVGQNELEDFLATGKDLEVGGLMEDVNLKDIEEPVVENGTHYKQEQEGGKFVCSECNAGFGTDRSCLHHKRSKHEGVRYDCNQCDYKATTQGNLTKHNKSIHEGVRLNCNQCDSTFTDKSGLAKHKQSKHEGVRYICDQCDSTFTDKGVLAKHKQSKHEGVRYDCYQCDYKATTEGDLIKHNQSKHEGVRYYCNHCVSSFTQKYSLTKHKQSKHEEISD